MKKSQCPIKRAHSPKGQRPGRYVAIRKKAKIGKHLGNTAVLDSAYALRSDLRNRKSAYCRSNFVSTCEQVAALNCRSVVLRIHLIAEVVFFLFKMKYRQFIAFGLHDLFDSQEVKSVVTSKRTDS